VDSGQHLHSVPNTEHEYKMLYTVDKAFIVIFIAMKIIDLIFEMKVAL
jgi:hypothetical protein